MGVGNPVLSVEERDQLHRTLICTNIARLRIVAWLMIAFMLVSIITQVTYIDRVMLPRASELATTILVLRFIIIGTSLAFLLLGGRPLAPEEVSRKHFVVGTGYVVLTLVSLAVLSGVVQAVGPGIASSYLMAVLVTAAFLYFEPRKRNFIFAGTWLLMGLAVWAYQPDWVISSSAFLNGTFATIMALVISKTMYDSRVQDFINGKIIEGQRGELVKSNEMFRRLSYIDGLTNIPNRRYFEEIFHREWGRAYRDQKGISLIMVDIDKFKLFNDTYGHQMGDQVLIKVAAALSAVVKRPGDVVARYGGEEFVAVLPDTDLAGAARIATEMREAIERLQIGHIRALSGRVTISLGTACGLPRDPEKNMLIEEADKALFRAKAAGGNCCEYYCDVIQGHLGKLETVHFH